jgi:AcrR family transcriptional regulator
LFREVRAFFGDDADPERKWVLTGRAQLLNEALFWSAVWLPRYSIRDFPGVSRRMLDILTHGLATDPPREAMIVIPDSGRRDMPIGRLSLLRSATRLINQYGYKGASVDRIMSELRLSKGTFYHHIDAKDDLVLQCLRESHRRLGDIQMTIDQEGGTHWERLARGIGSVLALQFASDYPLLRTTALQAMPTVVRDVALGLMGREAFWLSGMLTDAMQEGGARLQDPVIGGHLIISTINSAYDIRGWSAKRPLREAVSTYAGLLWNGIFD